MDEACGGVLQIGSGVDRFCSGGGVGVDGVAVPWLHVRLLA